MAVGNLELMHKHCPQHFGMGASRMKEDKDTVEEDK